MAAPPRRRGPPAGIGIIVADEAELAVGEEELRRYLPPPAQLRAPQERRHRDVAPHLRPTADKARQAHVSCSDRRTGSACKRRTRLVQRPQDRLTSRPVKKPVESNNRRGPPGWRACPCLCRLGDDSQNESEVRLMLQSWRPGLEVGFVQGRGRTLAAVEEGARRRCYGMDLINIYFTGLTVGGGGCGCSGGDSTHERQSGREVAANPITKHICSPRRWLRRTSARVRCTRPVRRSASAMS
eukprot:1088345-Prorocentrum_minimum.AAC.2